MAEGLNGKLTFDKKGQRFLQFPTVKGKQVSLTPPLNALSPKVNESKEAELPVKVNTGTDGRPTAIYIEGETFTPQINSGQVDYPQKHSTHKFNKPKFGKPKESQSNHSKGVEQTMKPEFHNPYNFVPAPPRDKATGELGDRLPSGHDRFCSDKYTGKLRVKMTVKTPLLLPDTARMHYDKEHKSYPVREENGKPLIEPTAIKGMLRAAYEAVTNSRISVFRKHEEKLAFRAEVGEGLFAVPARIEGTKGNEEIVLYTGKSNIDPNDGGPEIVTRKTNGQPGKRKPQFAAWISKYKKNACRNVSGKMFFQYADVPIKPIDDAANFPLHGKQAWAWIEFDNTKQERFTFYRVIALAYDHARLGPAPNPGCECVQGYVCNTGKNMANKHDERFFFNPSQRISLKKEHIDFWNRLVKDYRKQHETDFNLPPKDKVRGGTNHGQEYSLEWSRHIQNTDISETEESTNLVAEELKHGTLCYARVRLNGPTFEVIGLFPVMISRRLHGKSPAELLPKSLHPAYKLSELSPADRVFGWVRQADKEKEKKLSPEEKKVAAYRGQLRIGAVTCNGDKDSIQIFGDSNPKTWLPLQILGQPKPQQGRFYVAKTDKGEAQIAGRNNEEAGYKTGRGLRGRKVYPHHTNLPKEYWFEKKEINFQEPNLTQQPVDSEKPNYFREYIRPSGEKQRDSQNRSIQGWVKPGTEFEFDIHFNNLSEVELGALVWLLTLNKENEDKYFHRFGGGKPLGFGSVKLEIAKDDQRNLVVDIRSGKELNETRYANLNDDSFKRPDLKKEFVDKFEEAVQKAYPNAKFLKAFRNAAEGFGTLPTHYPRTRQQGQPEHPAPNPKSESFKWFVQNSRTAGGARPGYVLPDLENEIGLPILAEEENRQQHVNTSPQGQRRGKRGNRNRERG